MMGGWKSNYKYKKSLKIPKGGNQNLYIEEDGKYNGQKKQNKKTLINKPYTEN
jgi:hypothetical protein